MGRRLIGLTGALLTGLLLAAAFPPLDLRFLAPLALIPLLYALAHEPSALRRFLTGWFAGFLFWILVCHWIRDTLAIYGGLTGPLSWLALFLFAVVKGLHLAVFAAIAGLFLRRPWAPPALAALWTGIERTHGPLGFAWLALGNAGIDMPFPLRLAPLVGVYGLSFLFALISAVLTAVLLRQGRRQWLWLAPFGLLFAVPPLRPEPAAVQHAVAAQVAVADETDWSYAAKEKLVSQLALLTLSEALDPTKLRPGVLLWPEAPAPFYFYEDPSFRRQTAEIARLASAPFLFSGVAYTTEREPLNSAFVLSETGRLAGRYDKNFLVPFGEFVPPGFGWIGKVSDEAGNFKAGERIQVFPFDTGSFGVVICYESAFPHLVRSFVQQGADVLVNLTNDGYFGRSAARPQHLLLARMRAAENARFLLRAANDGVTASIGPNGQIVDRIPEFQRRATRLRYQRIRSQTPYSQFGDWFAWLCFAASLGAAAFARFAGSSLNAGTA